MSFGLNFTPHYIEIPPIFRSQETGGKFEHCLSCDAFLLLDGRQYLIEKAYRRYPGYDVVDTVFEYAMCMECYEKIQRELSSESLIQIEAYFTERIDFPTRSAELLENDELDVDRWIGNCLVSGTAMEEAEEFQIFAQCDGGDMLFTFFPYMLSGTVIEEIAGLLSNKTLGEIDGFMGEHFGLPPELNRRLMPI